MNESVCLSVLAVGLSAFGFPLLVRVQASDFRVWGLGVKILGYWVEGFVPCKPSQRRPHDRKLPSLGWFRVGSLEWGFGVSSFGFGVWRLKLGVWGLGLGIWGFIVWVAG
jgi:hypothetical protein